MKSTLIDRRSIPAGARLFTWTAGDGWPIRRMDWRQPEPGKARGSLIFLGGRGDFIEKYLEPLAHWHGRGWNVASFDWRSQGESRGSIRRGHLESLDGLVADGAALVADWLKDHPGPHVAVAHSMGGHLLLRILAEHKPPLSAAVLVAPMIGINSAPLPRPIAQATAGALSAIGWSERPVWIQPEERQAVGSRRQSVLTSCPDRYRDELWWFRERPGYSLGAPTFGWLRAAYASIGRLRPSVLRSIDIPLLLIGTGTDRLVSAAAIRQAARILPNAELLMFEDAGHEILRERDEVRLEALGRIDRFLDERAR